MQPLQIIWDYLCLHRQPEKADVIVGFGNFNTDIAHNRILGVHQPFMERRITAAMGVYWPELQFSVTSPQVSIPEYLRRAKEQGISENASISVIVGDFQRIELYGKLGYQLPQYIPDQAWDAYHQLVAMGYDKQLAK